MKNRWMQFLATPVLAMALVLSSCQETGKSPVEPNAPPQFDGSAPSGVRYRAVQGDDGVALSVSVTLDGSGASMDIGPHRLIIPSGAVTGPTLFTATLKSGYMGVDLTATSVGSLTVNDVGQAGFLKALTLVLSYRNMTETIDPEQLYVGWERPDGRFEIQETVRNTTRAEVEAVRVWHFSGYLITTGEWCDPLLGDPNCMAM